VRLFVAVSLPPEVLERVAALERPRADAVRWTTAAQWHVTLRFLGEVDDPAPVASALEAVPGRLRADGVRAVRARMGPAAAWFPGRHVLQLPVDGLDALARAVAEATAPWGGPEAAPEYRGHLTLARARGRRPGPASLAGAALEAAWDVDECALMASTLGSEASRYETLARVPLGLGPA